MKNQRGQSLIEIVVALALVAIVFVGSWRVISNSFDSIINETAGVKANFLVIEGLEGMRSIRDEDWNSLTDGTWHFEFDESDPENKELILVEGSEEVLGRYTRSIQVRSVRRDDQEKITTDDTYEIDTNTKLITVNVEWYESGKYRSDSESIYLTNWVRF